MSEELPAIPTIPLQLPATADDTQELMEAIAEVANRHLRYAAQQPRTWPEEGPIIGRALQDMSLLYSVWTQQQQAAQ